MVIAAALMATVFASIGVANVLVSAQDESVVPSERPSLAPSASPQGRHPIDSPTPSAGAASTVVIEAGDLWFGPNEVSIAADEPTELVLVGVGQVVHNLMVDDLGIALHVGPGISSAVTVSDLPPGTYPFYCSIFGHARAGMVGTLTIE